MKKLLVLVMLLVSAMSFAGGISVTVGGKTYSCGDNEVEEYRFYCDCYESIYYLPIYMKVNIQSGNSQQVKNLDGYFNDLTTCKEALKEIGICRGL